MTRSTHIKSRKPRNKKLGTRKRGTRKPQSGGISLNPMNWFRSISSTTGDSTNPQSKDVVLKQKLTTALTELSNILPQVEICAKKSGMENEEARRPVAEPPAAAMPAAEAVTPATQDVSRDQLMGGGSKSSRRGRGRAPPKGGPKGKKGMMVGPRKGPIIF